MRVSKEIYKEKSKETFGRQAENYEQTYNGKHSIRLYDALLGKVKYFNPQKLLDVGCGTGTILSRLAEDNDISLAGIDLTEEMLNVARERLGDRAELRIGDSERLPWGNNSFDIIICSNSFHHYPEPMKVLSEMLRVLNPKGHLIIGDPTMPPIIRQICNNSLKYSKQGDYRLYSKLEMDELLRKCGFKLSCFKKITYNSFILDAEVSSQLK
ncbi:class I SAM-dependent methyltransferase [Clostridium sp. SHJSY1]|uniref:class I SAM-dependent methyltransferase n=1 Tax=Clostridium sp. SHJSY1 TaxID=2942483 RepID=UPI002876DB24|nr:class I SAM-dependent methyltransferase [Clostridium sp. SHJSY1]MDS0526116.1 class I SAM-dependent methyltransferase [Clostridium sp. SHJSY1]